MRRRETVVEQEDHIDEAMHGRALVAAEKVLAEDV
jgi:hypothetical protein